MALVASHALMLLDPIVRGILVAVLLTAAVGKTNDFRSFRATLTDLGFPSSINAGLAAMVIGTEFLLACTLALGIPSQLAGALCALLFAVFAAVSLLAERVGRVVSCGCFGAGELNLGTVSAVRSAILAALSLILLLTGSPNPGNGFGLLFTVAVVTSASFWLASWRRTGRPAGFR